MTVPSDVRTWPDDLIGYRLESDTLVFKCACACGGHVEIARTKAVALDVARHRHRERAKENGQAHCFGSTYYIEAHEPFGIVAQGARTGKRTQLRAST